MKDFADGNFKFDENSEKFSKTVENTVGKGEIAHHEQFLLSHSIFRRLVQQTRKKPGLVWEWVKRNENFLDLDDEAKEKQDVKKTQKKEQNTCVLCNF